MIIELENLSEQVILRRPKTQDADDLYQLLSDFEVVSRLRTIPWPADRDFCIQLNERAIKKWQDPENLSEPWVIEIDGRHSGKIDAVHMTEESGKVFGLGYSLERRHWSKGIMSKAVAAVVNRCFTVHAADILVAGVLADNPASGHILQKQGFSIIGIEDTHFTAIGQIRPYVRYRLLREEWEGAT